ncbi:MAG TPA: hypothetical protein VGD60_02975 [Candidatus Acidoferrales bacterium]
MPRRAKDAPAQPSRLKPWQYATLNIFILFHIFAITAWAIPFRSPFVLDCRELVRPYMLWSGLFQAWNMFSPVPKGTNTYLQAVIIYKNGETQMWDFPRMELLSLTQKYSQERHRKFVEILLDEDNAALRPDVARYVARMPGIREKDPQQILLMVKWSNIIPNGDGTFTRTPLDQDVFFRYDVQPEDLR